MVLPARDVKNIVRKGGPKEITYTKQNDDAQTEFSGYINAMCTIAGSCGI